MPRRGPQAANQARRQVPIQSIPWNETQPGHFEVDPSASSGQALVHHGGTSSEGVYTHTLQMVDVATGWSERVAVLGRSWRVMASGFERILCRLPFPVLQIHSDNGGEFLNDHLLRFWREAANPQLSRGRPYHKNDQRFVEQKNATLVRAYLFQPVMRLTEKTVVKQDAQPARVKRRFDEAQTPFARLCAAQILTEEQANALHLLRDQTNPRQLRQSIYDLLQALSTYPSAIPNVTEDIFQTLDQPLWSLLQGASWLPQPTTAAAVAVDNDAVAVQTKEQDAPVTFSNERTIPSR